MGFDLVNEVDFVVECDDSGIVGKDGNEPVDFLCDLGGAFLDIGFEKGNDVFLCSRVKILVINFRIEYFMFAVFGPCLCKDFQFNVGRIFGEPVFFAVLIIAEVVLDDLHFLKRQSKNAFAADLVKFLVRHFQIELADYAFFRAFDNRFVERNPVCPDFICGKHSDRFDEFVGENASGDIGDILFFKGRRLKHVFDGAEYHLVLAEFAPDDVSDCLMRRARHCPSRRA